MVLASVLLRGAPHPPIRPGFVSLTGLVLLLVFYFLPTIIAISRRSTMTVWVVLIDVLTGWTVIGWIGALVMAIASSRQQPTVVVNVPAPPAPPSGGPSPNPR